LKRLRLLWPRAVGVRLVRVDALIAAALRKIGALASGQAPSAPEAQDALEALRQMYEAFVAEGLFGRQIDIAVPTGSADFTARENRRYTVQDLADVTITLPTFIDDRWWAWTPPYGWGPIGGATPEPGADTRPPLDGNVIRVADLGNEPRRLFVWDAAIARWTSLLDLDYADEAPLSTRYGHGIAAMLGVTLSGEYGVEVPASTVLEAARCRSAMATRFDGPARVVPGVYI
jgi:hypothetical protein